jgi:hypothetical protein
MATVRTRETQTPPRSDAYTGLLAISLGAMIIGCVLLFLDASQYPDKKPELPPAPSKPQAAQAQPAAPPVGAPAKK